MHKRNSSQMIKASQQNMTKEPRAACKSMAGKSILSRWLNPSSSGMDTKIEELSKTLGDLVKSAKDSLVINPVRSVRKITPTTSIMDGSNIYGREKDKEVVLGWLLEGESAINGRVFVVAIGGMKGVGKTTLAQLVYNDLTVVNAFDLRVWVFDDSEDFDVLSITRTIVQGVTDACNCSDDLNLLQVKLRKKLSGKRCLIVLDNVCDLHYDQWDLLRQPFAGSEVKIVVTTRNNRVPPTMAAISTRHLKVLSDDDCLSMLLDHAKAKAKAKFETDPELREIVENLARKCKGLPLNAKSLGGRLRSTHCTEWKKIYIEL